MQPHRFERLRARLLRGGIAPRHVQRYLRELHDHYEDALQAELVQTADVGVASEAAWARLGTEESLAESVLERPELRSTAARFPALVFGAGPVLGWLALPIAIMAGLSLLPEASRHVKPTPGLVVSVYALWLAYVRLSPVLLGAVAFEAAARRRLRAGWPLAGAALIDVLAGSCSVYSLPGKIQVNAALLPWLLPFSNAVGPKDLLALGEGLLRAACMLALSALLQRFARRLGISGEAARAPR
jgi:hypothetical protein